MLSLTQTSGSLMKPNLQLSKILFSVVSRALVPVLGKAKSTLVMIPYADRVSSSLHYTSANRKNPPSITDLRSALASASYPSGYEFDNAEMVVAAIKSFQRGAQRVAVVSAYLSGPEGSSVVLELTFIPSSQLLSMEIQIE